MTIHLSLPPLAPGEQPPATCPHCGSRGYSYGGTECNRWRMYQCDPGSRAGAEYVQRDGVWMTEDVCTRPSAAAVARALLAMLTPEQKALHVSDDDDDEFAYVTVERSLIDVITTLEKKRT